MTDTNLRTAFRRVAPLVHDGDYGAICRLLSNLSSIPFERVYEVCAAVTINTGTDINV